MSHYAWYNLSVVGQLSLHHIIKAIAKSCENFVYAYLGIALAFSISTTANIAQYEWNGMLILSTLALCALSRAFNIFPFSACVNFGRKKKISFSMQIMMWFAGLRGAIAFALALNMTTPHSKMIVTTTLSVVIVTTLFCSSVTANLLHKLNLTGHNNNTRDSLDVDVEHDQDLDEKASDRVDYYGVNVFNTTRNSEEVNDNTNHQVQTSNKYQTLHAENDYDQHNKTVPIGIELDGEVKNDNRNINNIHTPRRRRLIPYQYTGIHKLWHEFDQKYMMKWFGGSKNVGVIAHSVNVKVPLNENGFRKNTNFIKRNKHHLHTKNKNQINKQTLKSFKDNHNNKKPQKNKTLVNDNQLLTDQESGIELESDSP